MAPPRIPGALRTLAFIPPLPPLPVFTRAVMKHAKTFVVPLLALFLLHGMLCSPSTAVAPEAEQNVRTLNNLNVSLYKIANSNNKAVLEEEYDTINNDIRLDAIGDRKLVGIIQALMDALTALRLSEEERSRMRAEYERQQEELMLEMLRNGGKTIGAGLAHAAASGGQGFMAGGPWGAAAGVIASMPTVASSVTKPAAEMRMQKQKIEDFEWNLDKERLERLNELNKKFLATYWDFLHDSHVPDALRISEKQIASLLDVIREKDPAVRYRMLVRLEKECGNIPAYWYYRADAAHDLIEGDVVGDPARQESLKADIRTCLERYRQVAGMLRKDSTLASLLMLYLATAELEPDEARGAIAEVVEPFPLDASKRLFAALTSLKYGLADDAIEHLHANLDMRQYEVISRKLLADIYGKRQDEQRETRLVRKLLNEDAVSNQELLYHLGKLQAYEKFMEGLEPQLSAINMRVKRNLVGNDDVEILLPMKWEILENVSAPATLKMGDTELKTGETGLTKDGNISIVFKKAVKDAELAARGAVRVRADIPTRHFPVIIEGRLEYPESGAADEGGMVSKLKGKARKMRPVSQGAFHLERIACEDIAFQKEGGKWVRFRGGGDR